ncbi:rho-related GTP-binding protein RhoD isoform X2 [Trichechus manatus latirostris]|uniref:Rho-related GTP-binding protein RhoD isoform X2 n=1 Tax=Trichechus manatus latirostris TaxID=127582 RepID=A0A2Y9FZE7_TRIMA|nr:rho-related GTP-binding protein RhoD isoform X2 [Trichechus manatus latirostris]
MKTAQDAGEEAPPGVQSAKVVLVGDGGCGKTSLLMVFAEGDFPEWYPEVSHFCKETPIVIVGCKTDLRKDDSLVKKLRKNGLEPVTYNRGQEMARSVGAVTYLECSARLHDNVHAVFQEAAKVALSSRRRNFWRRITRNFCMVT